MEVGRGVLKIRQTRKLALVYVKTLVLKFQQILIFNLA